MAKLLFTPKTFALDHVIRNEQGRPLGRIVMYDDDAYVPGEDIKVAILKIPLVFEKRLRGLVFYIDEFEYKIPEDVSDMRINNRKEDAVASSFVLKRVD